MKESERMLKRWEEIKEKVRQEAKTTLRKLAKAYREDSDIDFLRKQLHGIWVIQEEIKKMIHALQIMSYNEEYEEESK